MKRKTKIIVVGLLILFLIFFSIFLFDRNLTFDEYIYRIIRSCSSDFFDKYFIFITKMANTITILGVVLLFLILSRNIYGVILTFSMILSSVSNFILKNIVRRARPDHLRLIKQGGYSFPSGHAMIAICVYGYILYLVVTCIKNKLLKIILSFFLILLIISIGISRIYVGVHYPTDVICGYLLALVEVIFLINFSNRGKNKNEKDNC